LKAHAPLLAAFATSIAPQVALMTRMQVYCYDNQSFLKLFNKLVMLLYKGPLLAVTVAIVAARICISQISGCAL
jgi:hypothetical protein